MRRGPNSPFGVVINGQHNGKGHVHQRTILDPKGIEMQTLKILLLPHEPSQGTSPPFPHHMHPLKINPCELHLGQRLGLSDLSTPHTLRHHKIHQCPSIRLYQRTLDHSTTLHSWPNSTRGDDQRVGAINGIGTNIGVVGRSFESCYLFCMVVVGVEGKVGRRG